MQVARGRGPRGGGTDGIVGRAVATQAREVNYRTMTNCYDSRRMQQALMAFQDAGSADEVGGDVDAGCGGWGRRGRSRTLARDGEKSRPMLFGTG